MSIYCCSRKRFTDNFIVISFLENLFSFWQLLSNHRFHDLCICMLTLCFLANVSVQWVKLQLVTLAFNYLSTHSSLATLLSIQLQASQPRKAVENIPVLWALSTHVRVYDGVINF